MSSTDITFKTKKSEFKTDESFWMDFKPNGDNQSVIDTEDFNFNIEKIADKLLSEFIHSTDEQKKQFRPMIIEWLKTQDLKITEEESMYELRDLIYEMF